MEVYAGFPNHILQLALYHLFNIYQQYAVGNRCFLYVTLLSTMIRHDYQPISAALLGGLRQVQLFIGLEHFLDVLPKPIPCHLQQLPVTDMAEAWLGTSGN